MNTHHEIARAIRPELLAHPNVWAVGAGEEYTKGRPTFRRCLSFFVERKVAPLSKGATIPTAINGIPTDVVELAPPAPPAPATDVGRQTISFRKQRPFYMASEIGPYGYHQAGTLGLIIRVAGADYALTNWHVMHPKGKPVETIGRAMVQPAGSRTPFGVVEHDLIPLPDQDNIGDAAAIKLKGSRDGTWDKQIDRLTTDRSLGAYGAVWLVGWPHRHRAYMARIHTPDEEKLNRTIPPPQNLGTVQLGDKAFKFGRTTRFSNGQVIATDAQVHVNYGDSVGVRTFSNQIIVQRHANIDRPIAAPGDSGSIVQNAKTRAVGLLFAGPLDGSYFIASPIQPVLRALFPDVDWTPYNLGE